MSLGPATVRWRPRMVNQKKLLILRLVGLFILLGALAANSAVLVWLALIPWLLVWGTAAGRRKLFLRNLHGLPRLDSQAPLPERDAWPKVTVIAPGRNEEGSVEAGARSLALLDYPEVEVFAVNDHSTDRTGAILDRVKEEFPHLQVVHDPPVQPNWLGKANAIWHCVQRGDPRAEWLLLTDADAVLHPSALKRAVDLCEERGLDLLTCIPYLENGTIWEELAVPVQWQGMVCGARYDRLNDPRTLPPAVGAFMLVRRRVYLASGGHSAFASEQPEDTLLAATIKEWGGKLGAATTPDIVRVRQYEGRDQLVRFTVRKNRIWGDDKIIVFAALCLYWLLVYVLPLPLGVAAVAKQVLRGDFGVGLTLYAGLAFLTYWTMSRCLGDAHAISRFRRGLEWAHPLAGLFRLYMETLALLGALFRRPLEWRGRTFVNIRTAR